MSQNELGASLKGESLYETQSARGNPELATVLNVISELDMHIISELLSSRKLLSNQPLERTGPHSFSASPPQALCLPLRGSVRRMCRL